MNIVDPELIHDVIALTGTQPPGWLDPSSPVLQSAVADEPLYLIGVIGGKDVGKSSLINAFIGSNITRVTSFGEGTSTATAYVHQDDEPAASELLSRIIPDQFQIATHNNPDDRGRVLLDLPDIDSVWNEHFELTRKLLRHMLYPIWVQSIEKYADREPLQFLGKIAAGNSPENFLFALTKCDQLVARHGQIALEELRRDYAVRVARACGLDTPPIVHALNALDPSGFDLPQLAQQVLSQRSMQAIARSRDLATKQQGRTAGEWLRAQKIDQRLAAAERLLADAEEAVASRLTEPLVEQLSNRLANDVSFRTQIIEPVVRERLSYWPIVNVIDSVLGPVVSMVRTGTPPQPVDALAGRDLSQHVRGTFADLVQRDPRYLELYATNKLWENEPASIAAAHLTQTVESAIAQHRATLVKNVSKPPLFTRMLAPILTFGAALWFPIVQPILEIVLARTTLDFSRETALLIIQLLGATYLVKSVGFLAIYFVSLWLWLRWRAARRVMRELRRTTDAQHPAAAVLAWAKGLVDPVYRDVSRLRAISARIDALSNDQRSAA